MRFRALPCVALTCVAVLPACASHSSSAVPTAPAAFAQAVSTAGAGGTNGGSIYPMGDGGTQTGFVTDLSLGADGQLYYAATPAYNNGWSTTGEIGSFNPITHAQVYQLTSYGPGFIQETGDGSVWVTEFNNSSGMPTVDRYAGVNGQDATIPVPFTPGSGFFGNGIDGGLAVAPDTKVWIGSNNSGQVGYIDPSTNSSQVYNLTIPSGGATPVPQFMTIASDENLWVTDAANTAVFRVVAQGSTIGSNTSTPLPEAAQHTTSHNVQGIIQATDAKLYTGDIGSPSSGWLDKSVVSATPSFASVPLPAIGTNPYVFAASGTKLYFLDYHFNGLGVYDVVKKKLAILPLVTWALGNLAVDSTGMLWTSCYLPASKTSCIQNVPITSTWQAFPSRSVTLYTQWNNQDLPPGIIGIGETGDSSPFTVTSSNSSICTAAMIPRFDHDVQVNPVSTGRCGITIADTHGRIVKIAVQVVNGPGLPQLRIDRAMHRPAFVDESGS